MTMTKMLLHCHPRYENELQITSADRKSVASHREKGVHF